MLTIESEEEEISELDEQEKMNAVKQWIDCKVPNRDVHFERKIIASSQLLNSNQNLLTTNSYTFQTQVQIHSEPFHDILHHINT